MRRRVKFDDWWIGWRIVLWGVVYGALFGLAVWLGGCVADSTGPTAHRRVCVDRPADSAVAGGCFDD